MAIQIQVRRDTAANWTAQNPTLAAGEWAYETDTGYLKIGNGSTIWASLAYTHQNTDADNAVVTETGIIIPGTTNVQAALRRVEAQAQNLEETVEQHHHDSRYDVEGDSVWRRVGTHPYVTRGMTADKIVRVVPFDPMLVAATTGVGLVDGQMYVVGIWVPRAMYAKGLKLGMVTQGSYTADQTNQVGLYSSDGTTLTLVASSTNNANIWKAAASAIIEEDFTTPTLIGPGLYYYAMLYNSSAQVTAPAVAGTNAGAVGVHLVANQGNRFGLLAAQNVLASSVLVSSITWAGANMRYAGLY